MKFSVSFDVTLPMGEVITCFSEPIEQDSLPEFITALTSAGHTLVEVHRIPLCDYAELYPEDIMSMTAPDEEPEEEVYIEEEECFDEEPVDVDEFVNRQRADY